MNLFRTKIHKSQKGKRQQPRSDVVVVVEPCFSYLVAVVVWNAVVWLLEDYNSSIGVSVICAGDRVVNW